MYYFTITIIIPNIITIITF